MKTRRTAVIVFGFAVLWTGGCQESQQITANLPDTSAYRLCAYAPAKIHFVGLTEFIPADDFEDNARLTTYIDLLDEFGFQIKSPAVLRFELYEYVPRSAEEKGKRLHIWPDIDLTDPGVNNTYWRDFLRAYKLDLVLDFVPKTGRTYVLQVTCLCPANQRLSDTIQLKYNE